MTGKEILDLEMVWDDSGLRESIGDAIRDIIDQSLCEEIYSEICDKRGLTGESAETYSFYDDPIWKEAWNRKVGEMVTVLKL